MDGGAWLATVQVVEKSWAQLSNLTFTFSSRTSKASKTVPHMW